MNIVVVHYHLGQGGVARVIRDHLSALDGVLGDSSDCRILIAHGGGQLSSEWRGQGWAHLKPGIEEIPELAYEPATSGDYRTRQKRLTEALLGLLGRFDFAPGETVIHVHNHSLGKSAALPMTLTDLANHGFGLLLQIHDFVEDFRPGNYAHLLSSWNTDSHEVQQRLYPQSNRIHYVVINRRDWHVLDAAGVNRQRLHYIPNPAPEQVHLARLEPDKRTARVRLESHFGISQSQLYILYPVRGIRRKNLGEALLISALLGDRAEFGLTLPAIQPAERPSYLFWQDCARELDLPWHFEMGLCDHFSWADNRVAADANLTTSVAEGFGLIFLECWLAGKPLIGRELPELSGDFTAIGLRFPHLYQRLSVPIDGFPVDEWKSKVLSQFSQTIAAYGLPSKSDERLSTLFDAAMDAGQVDFSHLPRESQRRVVNRAAGDSAFRENILELNPLLLALERDLTDNPQLVEENAACIQQSFSLENCGRQLLQVYQCICESSDNQFRKGLEDPDSILRSFLTLDRFSVLRVE
jgi:glycosyltransferase involved in cell wall biosynthesis